MNPQPELPSWLTLWQRPFPDANTLLLHGRQPVLIHSGFVGHAEETAAWAHSQGGAIAMVVNTHWHSDHVGGNALLQTHGAAVGAGAPEAAAIARRDPGCCAAEYLDQPVAPYTVDLPLHDKQVLRLGDTDWQTLSTPGHTPGHLALWQLRRRAAASAAGGSVGIGAPNSLGAPLFAKAASLESFGLRHSMAV